MVVVIAALFKELRIVSFDPTFAATIGISPNSHPPPTQMPTHATAPVML